MWKILISTLTKVLIRNLNNILEVIMIHEAYNIEIIKLIYLFKYGVDLVKSNIYNFGERETYILSCL